MACRQHARLGVRMKRNCYYVLQRGNKWTVGRHHDDVGAEFLTAKRATDAALLLARTCWKLYGFPSCVCAQNADGDWITVEDFGVESEN